MYSRGWLGSGRVGLGCFQSKGRTDPNRTQNQPNPRFSGWVTCILSSPFLKKKTDFFSISKKTDALFRFIKMLISKLSTYMHTVRIIHHIQNLLEKWKKDLISVRFYSWFLGWVGSWVRPSWSVVKTINWTEKTKSSIFRIRTNPSQKEPEPN